MQSFVILGEMKGFIFYAYLLLGLCIWGLFAKKNEYESHTWSLLNANLKSRAKLEFCNLQKIRQIESLLECKQTTKFERMCFDIFFGSNISGICGHNYAKPINFLDDHHFRSYSTQRWHGMEIHSRIDLDPLFRWQWCRACSFQLGAFSLQPFGLFSMAEKLDTLQEK